MKRVTSLREHSENGYQIKKVEHTVMGKFCGHFFTHRYTADQQAPPGVAAYPVSVWSAEKFAAYFISVC